MPQRSACRLRMRRLVTLSSTSRVRLPRSSGRCAVQFVDALVRVQRRLQPAFHFRLRVVRLQALRRVHVEAVEVGLAAFEQGVRQVQHRAEQRVADPQLQVAVEHADAAGEVGQHGLQQHVVLAQLLGRLDLRGDVQRHAHSRRRRGPAPAPDQEVPHHAVGAPDPVAGVEIEARRGGRPPLGEHPLAVVGMDRLAPAIAQGLLLAQPRQLLPGGVAVDGAPRRIGVEDAEERAIRQRPELPFAVGNRNRRCRGDGEPRRLNRIRDKSAPHAMETPGESPDAPGRARLLPAPARAQCCSR